MSENARERTDNQAPTAPKLGRAPRVKKPTLQGERIFQPGQPTSGADLMAIWDLPQQAHRAGRLKVSRKRYPTNELELLDEMLVEEFDLGRLAHDFGPGDYHLLLSADPQKLWGLHNCKVSVAPEYAAARGFQVYQERQPVQSYTLPRISEANALQAAASALGQTDRPLKVSDLAQLMEMMADRTAEAITRRQPAQLPPMQGDPMQFFGAVLTMQQSMEDRAFKVEERLMAGRPVDVEPNESSFAGDMMKLIPTLLQAFKRPDPAPVPPAPAQAVYADNPPALQETPPMQPQIQIPLTEEEAGRFALAVGMLRPWVPQVLNALSTETDVTKVAADLEGFIPPRMEQQLVDLNRLVQERGVSVLALIHPDLATPRGAELMQKVAAILTEP